MKPLRGKILVVALFVLVLAAPASAWASMPVNCGDILNIPGGQYRLNGHLNCSGNGVIITADNVHLNLAGYTLTGPSTPPFYGFASGIGVFDARGVHIEGGAVTGFFWGLMMDLTQGSHVNGMTLHANRNGLGLFSSSGNRINGNTSTGNMINGIILVESDRNQFHGNAVTFNWRGILLGFGTIFRGGDDNVFTSNILSNNSIFAGLGFDGVSNRNTARGNTINGNQFGVIMNRGENNLIQGNTLNDNLFAGISVGFFGPLIAGARIQGNIALNNTSTGPPPPGVTSPPVPADMIDWQLWNTGVSQVQWKGNTFVTDSEMNGPGAGWIR